MTWAEKQLKAEEELNALEDLIASNEKTEEENLRIANLKDELARSYINEALDEIDNLVDKMSYMEEKDWGAVKRAVSDAKRAVTQAGSSVVEAAKGVVSDAAKAAKKAGKDALKKAGEVAGNAGKDIMTWAEKQLKAEEELNALEDLIASNEKTEEENLRIANLKDELARSYINEALDEIDNLVDKMPYMEEEDWGRVKKALDKLCSDEEEEDWGGGCR